MLPLNSIGIGKPGNATIPLAAHEEQKTNHFAGLLQEALDKQDDKELHQACQDLESVFVYRMLLTMRNAIPHSDFVARGMALETFESMLDEEYAKIMSRQGSLGLADSMYRQLLR